MTETSKYLVEIKDDREEVRIKACEQLGESLDPQFVVQLVDALNDKSIAVREAAAKALAKISDTSSIQPLINCLYDGEHSAIRSSAIDGLVSIGKEAIPSLKLIAYDEDVDIRNFACTIMGMIQDEDAVGVLIDKLANDSDENVRYNSAEALGRIRSNRTVPSLISALSSSTFFVQSAVIDSLGKIKDKRATKYLIKCLENDMLCQIAIENIGRIASSDAIPVLMELLNSSDLDIRHTTVKSLINILEQQRTEKIDTTEKFAKISNIDSSKFIDVIKQGLNEQDEVMRRSYVLIAGLLKDPNIIPALLELTLYDKELQNFVIETILGFGDTAVDYLIQALPRYEKDIKVIAIMCLGQLKDKKAIGSIREMLNDNDDSVRANAIVSLGSLDAVELLNEIIGFLDDDSSNVREAVVISIGLMKDKSVVSKLKTYLKEATSMKRRYLVRILGLLRAEDVLDVLISSSKDTDYEVRKNSLLALSSIRNQKVAVACFIDALSDKELEIQKIAVLALGKIRQPEMIPYLIKLLSNENTFSTRISAINLLGIIGNKEIGNILLDLLQKDSDIHIKIACIDSIGKLKLEQSVDVLGPLLAGPEDEIKIAVINALGEMNTGENLLIPFISDNKNFSVKVAAIKSLGKIGGYKSIANIILSLTESNIQEIALESLVKIATRQPAGLWVGLQHPSGVVREFVVEIIGKLKENRFVLSLLSLLNDEVPNVRIAVSIALKEIGDTSVIDAIYERLAKETEKYVRDTMILTVNSLKKIKL